MLSDNYYPYVGALASMCLPNDRVAPAGALNLKPELKIGYAY